MRTPTRPRSRGRCAGGMRAGGRRHGLRRFGRRQVGRAPRRVARRRYRRDDHDVDARRDPDAERAARQGIQRLAQEPGRADRHPDRQLPGARRRGRGRQEPAGRVRLRRHLRAQLHVAGPLPRHHRPDRRAAVQGQAGPAHMRLGTFEGQKYTLPHTLDLSVLFWNKDLYKKAGLDPEKPPTTHEGVRRAGAHDPREDRRLRPTARSSAATAPAATCSRSGPRSGPAAARS